MRRLAPWLGLLVLAGYAIHLGVAAWNREWLIGPDGYPVPSDFLSWWSAGRLALEGRAAEAYDWALHKQAQLPAIGRDFERFFAWHNPPPYFLLVSPFALPPYPVGWILWILLTAAGFALALRLVLPGWLIPVMLAAPASLWCTLVGQNGFLTAALMTASLAWLDRRPWLAGFCLGVLTCKPQFGVLFPIFLAVERRWSVFAAAAATMLGLAAASTGLLGAGIWGAFLGSASVTGGGLLGGGAAWVKLQSVYSIGFQLTGRVNAAIALHAAFALLLGLLLLRQWRGPAPAACKAAALIAASYLVTPYAYLYDGVVLTAAAAFLIRDGLDRGFSRVETLLAALALLLPGIALGLGSLAPPAGCLILLGVALARSSRR
jgi:hypothetical protein